MNSHTEIHILEEVSAETMDRYYAVSHFYTHLHLRACVCACVCVCVWTTLPCAQTDNVNTTKTCDPLK